MDYKTSGFTPNKLVFGHNAVLTDRLPALQPTTSSKIVRKNMSALHSAREYFTQAENCEKIRRALQNQARTYADEIYGNEKKKSLF